MKQFIFLFAFTVLCHNRCLSENVDYIKTYGLSGPASAGRDIIAMPDGGAIIAATQSIAATSGNHEDILLIRVASSGDTVWTKTLGNSTDFHRAESIIQLSNANLLIAGNTRFAGTQQNALLICTDPNGNLIWEKTYGGPGAEFANAVKEVSDGFIIGGASNGFGAGDFDAWLLKTNANGDSLWSKTFGGAEYDDCWDIELTPEEGFMLTGGNYSFASGQFDDAWLIKTTPDGDLIWKKNYGVANRVDWAWALTPVHNGGVISSYVFVGVRNTEEDMPGAANGDLHFVKVDTAGNVIWDNSIDGTSSSFRKEGVDIKQLPDGGFIISGFQFTNTARQLYLVRSDESGVPVWDTSIGDNQAFMPWGASVTNVGSCFITGSLATSLPSQYIFLAKITGLPTTVKDIAISDKFISIYPNPAAKQFSVIGSASTNIDKVELYNLPGQLLRTVRNNGPHPIIIDVQDTMESILFVRVYTGNKVITRTLHLLN